MLGFAKAKWLLILLFNVRLLLIVNPALSQDLEPRRWTPIPVGINVIGLTYGRATGDLFFDPVLDLKDTSVEKDSFGLGYVRGFTLAGKLARFDAIVPWHKARWEGILSGTPASTERTGLSDPKFRLSMTLMGSPASKSKRPNNSTLINTVVGASVAVTVPLGKYNKHRLFNLGKNRYSIRPQAGIVHTRGDWSYELTGSTFFFTDNNDFFNNSKLEQKPIYAVQSHVVRTFKPGLWASLSAGYGWGGEVRINGERKHNERGNFLSAIAVGFPLSKSQGIKLSYVRARTQKDTGGDLDMLAVGWSILF